MAAVAGVSSSAGAGKSETLALGSKELSSKARDRFTNEICARIGIWYKGVDALYQYFLQAKVDSMLTLPRVDFPYSSPLGHFEPNFQQSFLKFQKDGPEADESTLLSLRDEALIYAYQIVFFQAKRQVLLDHTSEFHLLEDVIGKKSLESQEDKITLLMEALKRVDVHVEKNKRAIFSQILGSIPKLNMSCEEHAAFYWLANYLGLYGLDEKPSTPFPLDRSDKKA